MAAGISLNFDVLGCVFTVGVVKVGKVLECGEGKKA